MRQFVLYIASAILGLCFTVQSSAQVSEYGDFAQWQSDTGPMVLVDFVGLESLEVLSIQYAGMGVHFTDGDDFAMNDPDTDAFPLDGSGANSGPDGFFTMTFNAPQRAFGAHFAGALSFSLLMDGEVIYTTDMFGGSGGAFFGGIVSTVAFDEVIVFDPLDSFANMDNFYFSAMPVPTPGVGFLLGTLFLRSRRRKC